MRNLIDMTIDIEPLRYSGTFDVRIVEIGKHYECDLYIDNGEVECSIDIPTRDDKEDEAMQKRIIAAALEEYPRHIEGFNRFVNIECDGDYECAIKTLLNSNGLVASGSLSNYNKRVKRNIEASPKDMFTYESITKKYGKKNILRTLNESGNTESGQYMIGRLHRRSAQRSATDDYYRRRNISKEFDNLYKYNKGDWSAYDKGYDDEGIDIPTLKNRTARNNYSIYKMKDMDKLGKQFINFIESDDAILSLIVDYMSGNQNGKKYSSPLLEVIPEFEDNVLGYECTPKMRKVIERSFNEWWNYAEAELMHNYYEE